MKSKIRIPCDALGKKTTHCTQSSGLKLKQQEILSLMTSRGKKIKIASILTTTTKKKQSHEHNYEYIQYIGVYTQVILTCPNIRQDVVAYIEILEIFGSNQHFLGNYWHVVVG